MKWGFAAAVLVLLAAIAWWALADQPAPIVVSEDPQPVVEAASMPTVAQQVEARVVAAPPSLRGSELDGEVSWLPDGSVRIDLALRRRFDHLLSAIGEVSLAQIRSRLETELKPVASSERVAAVMNVFDRYVKYLDAVGRVQPEADPRKRLEQAHALRIEKLGTEIARAFFEDEERNDLLAIERREASPEKRAELDAQLAPELVQLRDTVADTARFEAEGTSAEERRRLREEKLGAEAAQRLGQLDEARAKWSTKFEDFKAKRTALEPLDTEDEKTLDAILERDFSDAERRRVRALLDAQRE